MEKQLDAREFTVQGPTAAELIRGYAVLTEIRSKLRNNAMPRDVIAHAPERLRELVNVIRIGNLPAVAGVGSDLQVAAGLFEAYRSADAVLERHDTLRSTLRERVAKALETADSSYCRMMALIGAQAAGNDLFPEGLGGRDLE